MTETTKAVYGFGVSPREMAFLEAMEFTHSVTRMVIQDELDKGVKPFKVADMGCGEIPLYTHIFSSAGTSIYCAFDKTVDANGVPVVDIFQQRFDSMPQSDSNSGGKVSGMKLVPIAADVTHRLFTHNEFRMVLMNHILQHLPESSAVDLVRNLKWPGNIIIISSYDWTPTFDALEQYDAPVRTFVTCARKLFASLGSNPTFGNQHSIEAFYAKTCPHVAIEDRNAEVRLFERMLGNYKKEVVPLAESLSALAKRIGMTEVATQLYAAINEMKTNDEVRLVPATVSFLIIR
jgi:hypothetical protein